MSLAGRAQLVKSIVQSMLIHCISIYDLPVSLIKDVEKCFRNFIWSGDIEKRKLVTVAWKNVCKKFDEGGLGIRSLSTLNASSNLKLCWKLHNSDESWAILLRSRVFRGKQTIFHHIFSSLWNSVKGETPPSLLILLGILDQGKC